MPLTSPTTSFLPDLAHERATSPLFKASAFAFRSFPLLIRLPSAFAPLGNKRHHHHFVKLQSDEFKYKNYSNHIYFIYLFYVSIFKL